MNENFVYLKYRIYKICKFFYNTRKFDDNNTKKKTTWRYMWREAYQYGNPLALMKANINTR